MSDKPSPPVLTPLGHNMRHWNDLKTTDPKYTKKVEFGRKFTSINSQWQLQRMTERFGPVGHGWGYHVTHRIERISDDYVLAIADVDIWVGDNSSLFGPVRGMSPILEKNRYDDDAGKKAMTDALTKGLSHLGLSADVFLGLFDDNKYVSQVREQFATSGNNAPAEPPKALDAVAPEDRHLVKGDGRSAYQIATAERSPGRAAAEFWASAAVTLFTQPGYSLLDYKEWKATPCSNKGTKTNDQKLGELREKHPDLADAIDEAVSNISAVAA